jgi:hypothetical protein
MADDSISSPDSQAKDDASPRSLTIWDNTPEEEDREIESFMESAWADMDASLPPYDWGDKPL